MLDHVASDPEVHGGQAKAEGRQTKAGWLEDQATWPLLAPWEAGGTLPAATKQAGGLGRMPRGTRKAPAGPPHCLVSPPQPLLPFVSTALLDGCSRIPVPLGGSSCLLDLNNCFRHMKPSGACALVTREHLERILVASIWLGVADQPSFNHGCQLRF